MNRVWWVVGLSVLGAATGRAADTYDLRGPAPEKGQVVVTRSTFTVTDAAAKITLGGQTLDATQTFVATRHEETKALAVDGRQVTRVQTRIVKERLEARTTVAGMETAETRPGDLEGELVFGERVGDGKWRHTLADNKPTEKQKGQLARRVGPESPDALHPNMPVPVGHAWTVDAAAYQRIFGPSLTDLKGKMALKFVRVEEADGEPCAVITSTGTIAGVGKDDDGDVALAFELTATTWRSLRTGLNVKDRATGRVKMSGTVAAGGGGRAGLVLEGPVTIEITAGRK